METNKIVAFGLNLLSLIGVNIHSKYKILTAPIPLIPVSITVVFNYIEIFNGNTNFDSVERTLNNTLIVVQVMYGLYYSLKSI